MNVLDTLNKLKEEWSAMGAVLGMAHSENLDLTSENTKLKELVKSLEWFDWDDDIGQFKCPICFGAKDNGHSKDCALSSALEETK